MNNLNKIGYGLLCLIVPLAWGLLVVWASGRVEAFLSRRHPRKNKTVEKAMPPIDYHI